MYLEGKNTPKRIEFNSVLFGTLKNFFVKFNIFLFSQDLPSFLNCQNKYDPTIRTGNKLLRLNLTAGKAMLVQNHRKNKDRAGARDQKTPRYITDTNLVLGPTNRNSQLHSLLWINWLQTRSKKEKQSIYC